MAAAAGQGLWWKAVLPGGRSSGTDAWQPAVVAVGLLPGFLSPTASVRESPCSVLLLLAGDRW